MVGRQLQNKLRDEVEVRTGMRASVRDIRVLYEVSDEIVLASLPPGFCVLVCVGGHELKGEARIDVECSAGLDGFDKEHTAGF